LYSNSRRLGQRAGTANRWLDSSESGLRLRIFCRDIPDGPIDVQVRSVPLEDQVYYYDLTITCGNVITSMNVCAFYSVSLGLFTSHFNLNIDKFVEGLKEGLSIARCQQINEAQLQQLWTAADSDMRSVAPTN